LSNIVVNISNGEVPVRAAEKVQPHPTWTTFKLIRESICIGTLKFLWASLLYKIPPQAYTYPRSDKISLTLIMYTC